MLDKHMTDRKWHEMLPLVGRHGPDRFSIPSEVTSLLEARLSELKGFVAGLTVMDLAEIWAERFAHPNIRATTPAALGADDQLMVSKSAVILRSDDENSAWAYWVHNGLDEHRLSLADPLWFENVMRAGSFTAAQSCHWGPEVLSWELTRSWLEELIDVGLVGLA